MMLRYGVTNKFLLLMTYDHDRGHFDPIFRSLLTQIMIQFPFVFVCYCMIVLCFRFVRGYACFIGFNSFRVSFCLVFSYFYIGALMGLLYCLRLIG